MKTEEMIDILKNYTDRSKLELEEHVSFFLKKYGGEKNFINASKLIVPNSFLTFLALLNNAVEEEKNILLAKYEVGKFVKYVRAAGVNKHLWTLGKEYEITKSVAYIDDRFGCIVEYTIIDDKGVPRPRNTRRKGNFVLV